jgi:hypothetical protein
VRAQLTICQENHASCCTAELPPLPTRVVDVSKPGVMRLIETRGRHGRYAALSHCWGKEKTLTTQSWTYESFVKYLPLDQMPKSFKDAIDFCRKLGFTCIWIDSLCIIQDSPTDWLHQSKQMQDIYQNAYITLAATASSSGDGGCYQQQEFQNIRIAQTEGPLGVPIFVRRRWHHVSQAITGPSWSAELIPPLLQRGWVLQERLLSRCVVHFTANEIMWECRAMENCECLYGVSPSENPLYPSNNFEGISTGFKSTFAKVQPSSHPHTRAKMWLALVERYSALALSYDSDNLPAFAGIARSMSGGDFGQYLAGIWRGHVGKGLFWMARQPPGRRSDNSNPSWSWTSIDGAVFYGPIWHYDRDKFVPLLSVGCFRAGPDTYGGIHHAWVKLEVDLIEAALIPISWLSSTLQQRNTRVGYLPLAIYMLGEIRCCAWDDDSCLKWLNSKSIQALNVAHNSATYCFEISGSRSICTCLVLKCEDWVNKVFRRKGIIVGRAEGIEHLDRPLLLKHMRDNVDRILEGPEFTRCSITII